MWNCRRTQIESIKELAMRAQPDELQDVRVRLAVNQELVRFQVAFPMIPPVASQSVIAVLLGQRLVMCQKRDDIGKQGI